MKIDAATFEVNMTNYPQDITKKQFRRYLTVPQYKQNFCTIGTWKKNISRSFQGLLISHNINVLLIDNVIKHQTSDFINKSMTARHFCNQTPIHFYQLFFEAVYKHHDNGNVTGSSIWS